MAPQAEIITAAQNFMELFVVDVGERFLSTDGIDPNELASRYDALSLAVAALRHAEPLDPVAWRHAIVEPDGRKNIMLSQSAENPWSHWVEKHLGECVYACTPLYDLGGARAD